MHQKPLSHFMPPAKDWPIIRVHKERLAFLQHVVEQTIRDITALRTDQTALRKELMSCIASEQERIEKKAWRVDASGDPNFWLAVIEELEVGKVDLAVIIRKIAMHYAQEMAAEFSRWHYYLAQGAASYVLNRLLNPIRPSWPRTLSQLRIKLQEKIHIIGAVKTLRQLAHQGTIVMVPTHTSHFDSVLMWWVIHTLGLPPYIYGAGINLFNCPFFAYFMRKLGAYKIDRRRKNIVYLSTLKAYSTLAFQYGCHSLFYPGGMRSRSGSLETALKLGLLGTVVEAQHINYQLYGPAAPRLFVVPVILSYHFVLEAPSLIEDYLKKQGLQRNASRPDIHAIPSKLFKFICKLATISSSMVVSIGRPLDVLGNEVDEAGQSYDEQGASINTYSYFCNNGDNIPASQGFKEVTRKLCQATVQSFYKYNCVLSSHLVAFIAFALMRQEHANLDLRLFFELPTYEFLIPYGILERTFIQVRKVLLKLYTSERIKIAEHLQRGSIAEMIIHGIANLGVYHVRKPLLRNKAGDIITQDLHTLFYYHNRLVGYGFEKCIEQIGGSNRCR